MKEFSPQELAEYNGKDGKPTYIAYKGIVYDISESRLWKLGLHMKRHRAGEDLSSDMNAAPHEADVLERFPKVGTLAKAYVIEPKMPMFLSKLIRRYPMLRRHPHPMTVHFPIVFMFSATIFTILYLVTGIKSFETTAFHCLGGGVIFTFVATATGFYTWWMNYLSQSMRAVRIKSRNAIALQVVAIIAFIWRALVPDILDGVSLSSVVYFILIFSITPLVTINGWFGASLTFPAEEE